MELEMLQKVIVEVLNVDSSEIQEDTTFMGDLGADSLDLFQIVLGIEDAFQIELDASQVEGIETVGQALKLIKNTRGVV